MRAHIFSPGTAKIMWIVWAQQEWQEKWALYFPVLGRVLSEKCGYMPRTPHACPHFSKQKGRNATNCVGTGEDSGVLRQKRHKTGAQKLVPRVPRIFQNFQINILIIHVFHFT